MWTHYTSTIPLAPQAFIDAIARNDGGYVARALGADATDPDAARHKGGRLVHAKAGWRHRVAPKGSDGKPPRPMGIPLLRWAVENRAPDAVKALLRYGARDSALSDFCGFRLALQNLDAMCIAAFTMTRRAFTLAEPVISTEGEHAIDGKRAESPIAFMTRQACTNPARLDDFGRAIALLARNGGKLDARPVAEVAIALLECGGDEPCVRDVLGQIEAAVPGFGELLRQTLASPAWRAEVLACLPPPQVGDDDLAAARVLAAEYGEDASEAELTRSDSWFMQAAARWNSLRQQARLARNGAARRSRVRA